MGMILTDEQQAILDGSRGETMAKVMKTLVMFGEAFHAEKMVPVTSRYNHLVTSFGLGVLQPVYDLMQQLIDAGAVSGQKFSADPRPLDPNVPANLLQQLVFKKFMYNKQDFYEGQLQKLGLMDKDAFTCTCYMPEVGNKPEKGEILSWSESSADDIREEAARRARLIPVEAGAEAESGPARMYRIEGGLGRLGFISPLTNHFCLTCNRLRLTSEGALRTCLFADKEYRLRGLLRHPRITDEALAGVIRRACADKPVGADLLRARREGAAVAARQMVGIGG